MGNEYALVRQQRQDLEKLFEGDTFRRAKEKLLANYNVDEGRILEIAIQAMSKSPDLITASPRSKLLAMLDCLRHGLEPDGVLGVILPYKNKGRVEAQFQMMYRGALESVRRLVPFRRLHAEVVREKDVFHYNPSNLDNPIHHEVDPTQADADRGDIVVAYAFALLADGGYYHRVVNRDDIRRAKSASKTASYDSSPWNKHAAEMWKKTAFLRLCKDLPRTRALPWDRPEPEELIGSARIVEEEPVPTSGVEATLAAVTASSSHPRGPGEEDSTGREEELAEAESIIATIDESDLAGLPGAEEVPSE